MPVAMDSTGRFYVIGKNGLKILVFDRNGRFESEFGKAGGGPGEVRKMFVIGVAGRDSLYVVDSRNVMTLFDAAHRFVRSVQLPARAIGLVVERDGFMTANASIPTADHAGSRIHGISPMGKLIRSIGNGSMLDVRCPVCSDQILSAGPSPGTIWVAGITRYTFGLWQVTGAPGRQYQVNDADWFKEWNTPPHFLDGTEPRTSSIASITVDSAQRIWVTGVHAPAGWKPRTLPDGMIASNGAVRGTPEQLENYLYQIESASTETVIDIIEAGAPRLLARARIPGTLQVLNSEIAVRPSRDQDGAIVIDVFRLAFRQ